MRLRRPPRLRRGESIVAMIDVVFFLLVFFLLVGRLDANAPFELSPPAAGGAVELPAGGAMLSLTPDGQLGLDQRPVETRLALERLGARLATDPGYRIRLEVDRDTPLHRLLPLVASLEALGARDVVLVVARRAQ